MPEPIPPELSRQKRLEGHQRSLELRRYRSAIKHGLRRGFWTLQVAWLDEDVQGMKIYDLLLALPYVGPVKADRLLIAAGIHYGTKDSPFPDRRKTVRACGPKQRERLFAALSK